MTDTAPTSPGLKRARPLAPLFRHARLAFRIYVGVQAAFCIFLILMAVVFSRAADGVYISPGTARELDLIGLVVGVSYLAVLIWTIVLVLRFTFRAMANLRGRGEDTEMSPTMAVVWYFIPFALLYFPFKGMQEIWRKSRARIGQPDPASGHLGAWWATWLVGGLLGNITLRLVGFGGDASLEMLALSNWIDAAGSLIHIASALLLLRILSEITTAQDQEIQ
ncbi:MAG: DUF4328 domain-containing protein [Alphaproteobacteria bacterium]|nr:DUF4328 domain-containing protein [Alphaproteobacteria bacterium]